MRKLQENPEDTEAMNQMETAQELLANWTGGEGRTYTTRLFYTFDFTP